MARFPVQASVDLAESPGAKLLLDVEDLPVVVGVGSLLADFLHFDVKCGLLVLGLEDDDDLGPLAVPLKRDGHFVPILAERGAHATLTVRPHKLCFLLGVLVHDVFCNLRLLVRPD